MPKALSNMCRECGEQTDPAVQPCNLCQADEGLFAPPAHEPYLQMSGRAIRKVVAVNPDHTMCRCVVAEAHNPMTHELKINIEPFNDLLSGRKTSEVRNCADRDFAVGDVVWLREWHAVKGYSLREMRRTIAHIQRGYGLPDTLCVLSYAFEPLIDDARPLVMPEQVPDKMVRDMQDAIEGECGWTAITRQQARNVLSYLITNMVRNGGIVGRYDK